MVDQHPYGTWPSPIDARLVAKGSVRIEEIRVDDGDLYWIESRPDEGGRQTIVRLNRNGSLQELLTSDFNARTRVHEYGGGHYAVRRGVVWFSNFEDQRLYRLAPGEPPTPITPGPDRRAATRFADACPTPDGRWLVCVRETHPAGEGPDAVVNDLVAVPSDGRGEIQVLTSGRDFYAAPRVSPDGTRLAWLSWDHPDMPWDATVLRVAGFDADVDRVLLGDRDDVVAGQGVSVAHPAWDASGVLHAISDATGWWNLHRFDPTGDGRYDDKILLDTDAEFARPLWVLGPPRYGFLGDGRIACTWFDGCVDRVGVLDADSAHLDTLEAIPVADVRAIVAAGDRVVVAGPTTDTLTAVHAHSLSSGVHRVLHAPNDLGIDRGWLPEADSLTFISGDDDVAHAIVYPPCNPQVRGPIDAQPPVVVFTHGGPTSHVTAALDLEIAYFTSRGFTVVDVNYRGSTGYGRAYRESLYGRWGRTDVEDVVAAARHLADRGQVDPGRMAIRGGSAGGYTTLCALTFVNVFDAGVSYYGVADLSRLAAETHKFEARYLARLVPPDEFDTRSPIHHTSHLDAPLLLLQGMEDEVVPPDQAEEMLQALRKRGIPHAYLAFPNEQHGFRRAETIVRALEAELAFYGRIFGFEPADDLPALDIRR